MAATRPIRPALDEEEEAAMSNLLAVMRRIRGWGLRANEEELAAAVHVIQGFITQHMLQRLNPKYWSQWYDNSE